jgi:hypothetical protein
LTRPQPAMRWRREQQVFGLGLTTQRQHGLDDLLDLDVRHHDTFAGLALHHMQLDVGAPLSISERSTPRTRSWLASPTRRADRASVRT